MGGGTLTPREAGQGEYGQLRERRLFLSQKRPHRREGERSGGFQLPCERLRTKDLALRGRELAPHWLHLAGDLEEEKEYFTRRELLVVGRYSSSRSAALGRVRPARPPALYHLLLGGEKKSSGWETAIDCQVKEEQFVARSHGAEEEIQAVVGPEMTLVCAWAVSFLFGTAARGGKPAPEALRGGARARSLPSTKWPVEAAKPRMDSAGGVTLLLRLP